MKVPLLDLKAQYAGIRDEVRAAIDDVCESQYFILGPSVEGLERDVAAYCGAAHGIGVSSGTDALLVTLMAMGVGPGDAVITTPYTFFATAGCVVRLGATPVFVDIDPGTYNIDPAAVRRCLETWQASHPDLTPRVLMPVHLFGQAADMDPLLDVAREFDLKVIEDACQAIGSEYPGRDGVRRAGSIGDAAGFSFFPSKNLGGFGDGGMVTVNDPELAERIVYLRNHGAHPKYYHKMVGGNFRLDAIQAAVLRVKLPHLDDWHAARRRNAARYDALFADCANIATPTAVYAQSGATQHHIYNQYVIRVPNRDAVRAAVQAAGVGCEVYYPVPLHLQECFSGLGLGEGSMPESERAANETLALPVYPELTEAMQVYVAETVRTAVDAS